MEDYKLNDDESLLIRNRVYQGGQSLLDLIEEVNFAIKYPIVEGTLINKDLIKGFLNEMLSNLDKTREQIIDEYDMDDVER